MDRTIETAKALEHLDAAGAVDVQVVDGIAEWTRGNLRLTAHVASLARATPEEIRNTRPKLTLGHAIAHDLMDHFDRVCASHFRLQPQVEAIVQRWKADGQRVRERRMGRRSVSIDVDPDSPTDSEETS